jgi:hypothetical protein
MQMLIWALDERGHPAFRDSWRADVADDLRRLESFVANISS